MKKIFFTAVFLLICIVAFTQDEEENKTVQLPRYKALGIFYDQDYTLEMIGLRKLNEDRNYTMGLGIYYSDPSLHHGFFFAPHRFLNRVFNKSFLNKASSIPAIMFANGTFTPDSLPAAYAIRNDRPYSSLTYLQTLTSYDDNERLITYNSSLSIGVLGTYISREIQTAIHETMNEHDTKDPRTPRGWNNQISAGGEPTLSYAFKKERLITKKYVQDRRLTSVTAIELKDAWQYSLGYYTSFNYEFDFRFGKIDPRHWTYMVNPLSQSDKIQFSDSLTLPEKLSGNDASPVVNYNESPKRLEIYLFGSARPSFILYNALLNGQFRKSIHTVSFHDMNHLVMDFDGGVATSIPAGSNKLIELKLKISGRSPEFELPGRAPRWHYWGGIELLFSKY